jgi:hypothetical protein
MPVVNMGGWLPGVVGGMKVQADEAISVRTKGADIIIVLIFMQITVIQPEYLTTGDGSCKNRSSP